MRVTIKLHTNPHHPWLSPLMADLTGLPPIMLHVGTHEIHFDDARTFSTKAEKNGVKVTLRIREGMVHAFPLLSPLFPETKNAMDEIGAYIRGHLKFKPVKINLRTYLIQ